MLLVLFVLVASGCASTKFNGQNYESMASRVESSELSAVNAIFENGHCKSERDISRIFTVSSNDFLVFGDKSRKIVAIPVCTNSSNGKKLNINSYVVSSSSGERYLYYPVVSLVNEKNEVTETIMPTYEFKFKNNVLTNEIIIPPGVSKYIIHTIPNVTDYSFDNRKSNSQYAKNKDKNTDVLSAISTAILLSNPYSAGAAAPNIEYMKFKNSNFSFSSVGAISVKQR
jgi:hypothetical protein